MELATGTAAFIFAAVHLWVYRLRFLDVIPAAVGYQLLVASLLPELSEHADTLHRVEGIAPVLVYLMALAGLVIFYALERAAVISRQWQGGNVVDNATEKPVFRIHTLVFAVYNMLIGYLLVHREETGFAELLFYTLALGVHFVVNDYGLRHHHKSQYLNTGRWILAGAILLGWIIGLLTEVPDSFLALSFSFLAGSIVLNVLKEELPEERRSRITMFVLGTVLYSGVLFFL